MRTDALEAAITADLAAGRRPLVVLAVAGTTNTGAVDDLPELARVCGRYGVWLHVDGAYGAFAALTERGPGGADRARARRLGHPRPAQVALPAVRVRCPPRTTRPPAEGRLRDPPVVPPGHDRPRRCSELRRARPAADQDEPGNQAVGLASVLRCGRLRRGDRPDHGPRRARPACDRGGTRPGAAGTGHPGHRRLPSSPGRARRRGGPRASQHVTRCGPRGERRGPRLLHPTLRPVRRSPVRAQPQHDHVRRRPGARLAADGDLPRRGRRGTPDDGARGRGDQDR